jgi:acetyl esterase
MRHRFELASLFMLLLGAGVGCAPEGASIAPRCAAEEAGATGSRLDPPTRAFVEALAALGGPPLYTLPVADARAFLVRLQAEYAPTTTIPADIEDHVLPVGPSGAVPIRIVRPQGADERLPIVMYFHGGGWILGDETTHDRLIREIATRAGAAVVFVKYTPSPEAKFPVPIQEAYAATRYVAENSARFGLDASRLAVAGDSVGGNMATVVALLAKQHGGPTIRYQVLEYPVTDACFYDASYRQFDKGPWLTRRAMEWFFEAYAPQADARALPYVSPLRASIDDLRGLPPALVIVDENDVLRDEGEAYAHRLMRAGVPVQAVRYLGTIHDFMMLNALADTPASRSATALVGSTLRDALSR